ncbi:hypothetical protein GCM10025779_00310 [Arthrobacter cryoconiti]
MVHRVGHGRRDVSDHIHSCPGVRGMSRYKGIVWPFMVGEPTPDDYEPTDLELDPNPPTDPYDSPSYFNLKGPTK